MARLPNRRKTPLPVGGSIFPGLQFGDYCDYCNDLLETLDTGGCGGNGAIKGCMSCGRLYQQEGGGIVYTGRKRLVLIPGSARAYKKKSENTRPRPLRP